MVQILFIGSLINVLKINKNKLLSILFAALYDTRRKEIKWCLLGLVTAFFCLACLREAVHVCTRAMSQREEESYQISEYLQELVHSFFGSLSESFICNLDCFHKTPCSFSCTMVFFKNALVFGFKRLDVLSKTSRRFLKTSNSFLPTKIILSLKRKNF